MRCVCCSKPMRRITTDLYAPQPRPDSCAPIAGWRYQGNLRVVSRRYVMVDPILNNFVISDDDPERTARAERRLYKVSLWDGKTYQASNGYFCTDRCAGQFAKAAYVAGYRMVGNTAIQRAA